MLGATFITLLTLAISSAVVGYAVISTVPSLPPTADVPARAGKPAARICMDVTDRQAQALDRLSDHLGKPVGRSWLMNELFPGKSAAEVHTEFDALIREITAAAPALGLVLVTQSGAKSGGTMYALKARPHKICGQLWRDASASTSTTNIPSTACYSAASPAAPHTAERVDPR
jgi:hypothetical protein